MGKRGSKMLSGIVLLWVLYHMDAPWWCWLIVCFVMVVQTVNAGTRLGKKANERREP